jgi:hypothetical protein
MKDQRFIGTGVARVTPFKNNEIDFVTFFLAKTFSYIKYFRRKLILIFRQYE